jgi:hypothetical protein
MADDDGRSDDDNIAVMTASHRHREDHHAFPDRGTRRRVGVTSCHTR